MKQEPIEQSRFDLEVNYHALLAGSPDTVVLFDLDQHCLIDVNTNAEKLFGRDAGALLSLALWELCPPCQADGRASALVIGEHIAQVLDGEIKVFEATFRHSDGHLVECEMRLVMLPVPGRRLMHARIVDITRRILADRLRAGQGRLLEMVARGAPLRETLDSLMLLIESQSDGVYCSVLLLDEDGITMHPAAGPSLPPEYMAALEGFPMGPQVGSCGTAMYRKEAVIVADIMNDPLWEPYKGLIAPHGFRACWSTPIFLHRDLVLGSFAMYYREVRSPTDYDMRLISVATHLAGIAIERTRRERELDQHRHHLEELVAARTNELSQAKERTELANRGLADALNNLRLAQDELVRRDKLAALGALVAGVAHELNTPIGNSLVMATSMADRTEKLGAAVADGLRRSTLADYLDDARQASELLIRNLQRAANLVSSFKQIAIDHAGSQRRKFSLAQLLGELLPPLCVSVKPLMVALELAVDAGITMDSYPGPLVQVISSLFENSVIHGFEGRASGTVRVSAQVRASGQVALAFADDGAGIDAANLSRVYDPFFTTRLGSGGSGLGLHIAHNIVCGVLGGRIELHSERERGATFTLVLPLVAPGAA